MINSRNFKHEVRSILDGVRSSARHCRNIGVRMGGAVRVAVAALDPGSELDESAGLVGREGA